MENYVYDTEDEYPSCGINLLPQYRSSLRAEHMFFESIGNGDVYREDSEKGNPKTIKADEEELESYTFFFNNTELQNSFAQWMIEMIGEEKFDLYCSIIVDQWSDGKSKRHKDKDVKALKKSINNYLLAYNNKIFCRNTLSNDNNLNTVFTVEDITNILDINTAMFEIALNKWMEQHPNGLMFGTNEIYLRRGINANFNSKGIYYENDYINSYSLSTTIVEQFSQTGKLERSVFHGEYGLFENRILFFTPFIKGMSLDQLELGIIPHTTPLYYKFQVDIEGIYEYLLDDK